MPCVVEHGYSRHHRVHTTAEAREYLPRVVWISGFAKDVVLKDNDRIRAKHDRSGTLPGNVLGFRIRYTPSIGPRHFTGHDTFIDVCRNNRERYGELRQ